MSGGPLGPLELEPSPKEPPLPPLLLPLPELLPVPPLLPPLDPPSSPAPVNPWLALDPPQANMELTNPAKERRARVRMRGKTSHSATQRSKGGALMSQEFHRRSGPVQRDRSGTQSSPLDGDLRPNLARRGRAESERGSN